ncbi:MAG: PTS sugar transporter subunit IIA [Lactobacillales bacterium]|jgi:PTS system mannose-specific IIA component|nr:PTS sugar transporter subunit IIA [Lactobacillales bacterium]
MIGIILIAHENIATEMLKALQHVAGAQTKIECVNVFPEDDTEKKRHEILEKTQKVDGGDGIIIISDMFGGTPSNLALSIMEEKNNIEVISGMNIPMLVKLASMRDEAVSGAAAAAAEAGQRYIRIASTLLKSEG